MHVITVCVTGVFPFLSNTSSTLCEAQIRLRKFIPDKFWLVEFYEVNPKAASGHDLEHSTTSYSHSLQATYYHKIRVNLIHLLVSPWTSSVTRASSAKL